MNIDQNNGLLLPAVSSTNQQEQIVRRKPDVTSSVERSDKYKKSRNNVLNINTYNMADGFS